MGDLLSKIKNKTKIDINLLIERLKKEFGLACYDNQEEVQETILYAIYDTMIIILDTTHQKKVPEGLYTTWIRMIKDYWYLSKYNEHFEKISNQDGGQSNNLNAKIKSIAIGDTTTTFADTQNQVEINGIVYSTGTINFDTDVLVEKYKNDLYRHRKMRW